MAQPSKRGARAPRLSLCGARKVDPHELAGWGDLLGTALGLKKDDF